MKLSSLKVSLKKKKLLSFQGKFRIWVFFGWNLKKNYCHFRNEYPRNFKYAEFHGKIKNTYI